MKAHFGKSKLHGKGVFATKDIKKGETIFILEGKKVKFLINNEHQANIAGMNWVGYDKNTWIDPIHFSVYLNHFCTPNSFIKGKKKIAARFDIKKGEEITIDYSLNEGDIFWEMPCHCGAKNCRKIIKSIQFLPLKTFEENINFIPRYFQKVYKKFNISNFKNYSELKTKWIDFISKGFSV